MTPKKALFTAKEMEEVIALAEKEGVATGGDPLQYEPTYGGLVSAKVSACFITLLAICQQHDEPHRALAVAPKQHRVRLLKAI